MHSRTLPGRRQARGMTLLEVCIAVGVLSTAILGVFSLFVTTERLSVIAREESIALYAAEEAINEIRNAPYSTSEPEVYKIVALYDKNTRPVNLDGPNATKQRLSMGDVTAPLTSVGTGDGIKVTDELGIVMINEESPDESHFGDVDSDGDLDFPLDLNLNGKFNDVLTNPFPVDLGGTTASNDTIATPLMKLVPVAVIVRWNSMAGIERRIQILTFINDRLGSLP